MTQASILLQKLKEKVTPSHFLYYPLHNFTDGLIHPDKGKYRLRLMYKSHASWSRILDLGATSPFELVAVVELGPHLPTAIIM